MITAKDLLREAETLKTQPLQGLVERVRQLGKDLRNVHGLAVLERDYRRAAQIYDEDLLTLVMVDLHPSETNRVGYNRNLV